MTDNMTDQGSAAEHQPELDKTALLTWDVSSRLGSIEYVKLMDDVFRMLAIQLTIQALMYFSGDAESMFTRDFLCLLLYIVLGVLLYWLVVKKVVRIV